MKVDSAGGLVPTPGAQPRSASTGSGFSIGEASAPQAATAAPRAAGAAPVASMDALLALQEVDGPLERRRRAVRRGGRLLDALDEVKLALLGGEGETVGPALQRLAAAAREQRAGSFDPGLDGVLDEIETRAAVELAKAEMSRLAA
jgi:hypothetical protein